MLCVYEGWEDYGVWLRSSGGSGQVKVEKVGCGFSEEALDSKRRDRCEIEFSEYIRLHAEGKQTHLPYLN